MHDKVNRALKGLISGRETISDPGHPEVLRFHALRDRAERDRTGRFQIDGLRFLIQAVHNGFPIHSLLVSGDGRAGDLPAVLLDRLKTAGTPVHLVSAQVLETVANARDAQGVVAITSRAALTLEAVTPHCGSCWLAVDSIQSTGNLGALMRTLDAIGGAGLIVTGKAEADPYDPACVRATMGAIFSQRIVYADFDRLRSWTRLFGAQLVATSPSARVEYRDVDFRRPSVILLGCERKGLAADYMRACDAVVRIPMARGCLSDSLNVAIAGSLLLYEAFNQSRGVRVNRGPCAVRKMRK